MEQSNDEITSNLKIYSSADDNKDRTKSKGKITLRVLIAVIVVIMAVGALIIYQNNDNKKLNDGIYLLSKMDISDEAKESDFLSIPFWDDKGFILSKIKHQEQISIFLNAEESTFNFSPSAISSQIGDDEDVAHGTYEYNPETREIIFYSDNGAVVHGTYYASQLTIEIYDGTLEFKHADVIPIYPEE